MRNSFSFWGDWLAAGFAFVTAVSSAAAGTALSFDGNDDYVSVAANSFPTVVSNFTIECWALPGAVRAATAESVSGTAGGSGQRFAIFPEQGQTAYGLNHAGAGLSIGVNGVSVFEHSASYLPSPLVHAASLGTWTHVAITYSNGLPRLYLNGGLVRTGLVSGRHVHPSAYLGGPQYGFFQGLLDEVRIWNVPLDAATLLSWKDHEVNSGHPNYGNLVGYWKLDEAGGTTTADQSSFGHSGTLQNGVTWISPGAPVTVLSNPVVVLGPVMGLTDTSARLTGTVNPRGRTTVAWFEWGAGTNYDQATTPAVEAGAGEVPVEAAAELTGLLSRTVHSYRLAASNSLGLARTVGQQFITRGPPTAVTKTLAHTGTVSIVFAGDTIAYGHPSWAWFDWGETTIYGNRTPLLDAGSNYTSLTLTQSLTGLLVGREYHYRFAVINASGVAYGSDGNFRTLTFSNTFNATDYAFEGSVAWADYDRDDDLDLLLVTGFGTNAFTKLYRNDPLAWFVVPPLAGDSGPSAGLPNLNDGSAAWGDFDNDGDLDLLSTGIGRWETWLPASRVNRNQNGVFSNSTVQLPAVQGGSAIWADLDNDGHLEIILTGDAGDWWTPIPTNAVFHNNGNGTFTQASSSLASVVNGALAAGDCDNDGDLDLLLSGDSSTGPVTKLYLNQAGSLVEAGVILPGVRYGSLAWGDYDNDGWLDILLAGGTSPDPASAICRLYRNQRDGTFTDAAAGLPGVWDGNATWGDFDQDGQLDVLVMAAAVGSQPSRAQVFRNEGGTFTDIGQVLAEHLTGAGAWGDYDGDGNLDVALLRSSFWFSAPSVSILRNCLPSSNIPSASPTSPSSLVSSVSNSAARLAWSAATDPHTPTPGLTYNVRVGTKPGLGDIVPPQSDPVTGRRWLPQMGNAQHRLFTLLTNLPVGVFYWSVQAVNHSFVGSAWSPEQTFAVTNVPPVAATLPASNVLCCSALLRGSVNPGGLPTRVWFEWGTNSSLGNSTPGIEIEAGLLPVAVTQSLAGLLPVTGYEFRVGASNAAGLAFGTNATFVTEGLPPIVATRFATNVNCTRATLVGAAPPLSPFADYFIEWGLTPACGQMAPAAILDSALHFDGADDCLEVGWGKFPAVTNNFTVELWVRPTAGRQATVESVSGGGGQSGQRYAIFPEQGNVAYGNGLHVGMGISIGTNGVSVMEHNAGYLPSVLVHTGELSGWQHVAVVYSNHVPLLHLNGSLVRTGLVSDKLVHPSAGAGGVTETPWSAFGPFAGQMQELRIWSTPLEPTTLSTWMNQSLTTNHPAFAHLQGYWPLSDGRGATAADLSTRGNTGQLREGAAWIEGRHSVERQFAAGLENLQPGTTYHFRAVGRNPGGTALGVDQTFTTLPLPRIVGGQLPAPPAAPSARLNFSGVPGATYLLEASTNLLHWFHLTNLVAGLDGAFSFTDLNATNFPTQFYRLRVP